MSRPSRSCSRSRRISDCRARRWSKRICYVVKALAAIVAVDAEAPFRAGLRRRHGARPRAWPDPAHVGGHRSADRGRTSRRHAGNCGALRERDHRRVARRGIQIRSRRTRRTERPATRRATRSTGCPMSRWPKGEGALRPDDPDRDGRMAVAARRPSTGRSSPSSPKRCSSRPRCRRSRACRSRRRRRRNSSRSPAAPAPNWPASREARSDPRAPSSTICTRSVSTTMRPMSRASRARSWTLMRPCTATFPAYSRPVGETLKAIDGIAASQDYAADYATFRRHGLWRAARISTATATLKGLAIICATAKADGSPR